MCSSSLHHNPFHTALSNTAKTSCLLPLSLTSHLHPLQVLHNDASLASLFLHRHFDIHSLSYLCLSSLTSCLSLLDIFTTRGTRFFTPLSFLLANSAQQSQLGSGFCGASIFPQLCLVRGI